MEAKLIVVGGKASKGAVALKLPSVIGRGREAGLTIAHPMISRRHCEIFESDGLLMVRDLGSLNGTVIDGRRIKEAPLPPDGEFTVGPLTFRAQYEYAGDLGALPETVLADPVPPKPEQPKEPWADSPQPAAVGGQVPFDPLTETLPPADEPAVELSFLEELELDEPAAAAPVQEQPQVQEQPPVSEEQPPEIVAEQPAAQAVDEKEPPALPAVSPQPAKPTAPKKKAKGFAGLLQGAMKKKGGKPPKPAPKTPAAPPAEEKPATEAPAKKPTEDDDFPFAPAAEGESAPSHKPAVNPASDDFDVDAFLDGLK